MVFNTEEDSIQYVCNYFEKKGFVATPTQASNQFCHYDITLTRGDKTIWVECKRRQFQSFLYDDVIIKRNKYDYFLNSKQNNLVDGVIIVTMFTDMFTLSNALCPVGFFDKTTTHTTEFDDKHRHIHHFVRYRQEIKIPYYE